MAFIEEIADSSDLALPPDDAVLRPNIGNVNMDLVETHYISAQGTSNATETNARNAGGDHHIAPKNAMAHELEIEQIDRIESELLYEAMENSVLITCRFSQGNFLIPNRQRTERVRRMLNGSTYTG